MRIKKLEKTAALQILYYLYQHPGKPVTKSELDQNIDARSETINSSLKVLANMSLINNSKKDRFPFRRLVSLTEKGRIAAKRVYELEHGLDEEHSSPE